MAENETRGVSEASKRIINEPSDRLRRMSDEMFDRISKYVRAELEATTSDYELLETINKMTAERYRTMTEQMRAVNSNILDLYDKHARLAEYIDQISELEDGVSQLEKTAADLDAYSRRLETKFDQLKSKS